MAELTPEFLRDMRRERIEKRQQRLDRFVVQRQVGQGAAPLPEFSVGFPLSASMWGINVVTESLEGLDGYLMSEKS